MKQHEVIAIINRDYPQMDSFVESEYQYTTYDAENKDFILEIKSRKAKYDKWIIEKHKFDANVDIALRKNKQFLYLTEYRTGMLVWNINDLINDWLNVVQFTDNNGNLLTEQELKNHLKTIFPNITDWSF